MKGISKTNIEYGEFGWNFYPGCLHKQQGKCPLPNCWAEGMSKRQREDFHKPHLIPERLLAPLSRKKPARILVNFMGDLMGDWVNPDEVIYLTPPDKSNLQALAGGLGRRRAGMSLKGWVREVCQACPQHQFFFLTKNPAGYAKWGEWPDNAFLGFSACNRKMLADGLEAMKSVKTHHKWISFEPLLEGMVCPK